MNTVEELKEAKLVLFRGRLAEFGFEYENDKLAYVRFLDTQTVGSVRVNALSVAPKERWDEVELLWGWHMQLKKNPTK